MTADVRFEISINGERQYIAGVEGYAVLSQSLSYFLHAPEVTPNAKPQLQFDTTGLDDVGHMYWPTPDVKPGDEIRIRILGPGDFDPPRRGPEESDLTLITDYRDMSIEVTTDESPSLEKPPQEPNNLFANISFTQTPHATAEEIFETLARTPDVSIERIVSLGHASPPGFWYDQPRDEWVLLVTGAARLQFETDPQPITLKPGDYLHIPAHKRHRVDWTDPERPSVWLAVHFKV